MGPVKGSQQMGNGGIPKPHEKGCAFLCIYYLILFLSIVTVSFVAMHRLLNYLI
jgi:hypothetical protein